MESFVCRHGYERIHKKIIRPMKRKKSRGGRLSGGYWKVRSISASAWHVGKTAWERSSRLIRREWKQVQVWMAGLATPPQRTDEGSATAYGWLISLSLCQRLSTEPHCPPAVRVKNDRTDLNPRNCDLVKNWAAMPESPIKKNACCRWTCGKSTCHRSVKSLFVGKMAPPSTRLICGFWYLY